MTFLHQPGGKILHKVIYTFSSKGNCMLCSLTDMIYYMGSKLSAEGLGTFTQAGCRRDLSSFGSSAETFSDVHWDTVCQISSSLLIFCVWACVWTSGVYHCNCVCASPSMSVHKTRQNVCLQERTLRQDVWGRWRTSLTCGRTWKKPCPVCGGHRSATGRHTYGTIQYLDVMLKEFDLPVVSEAKLKADLSGCPIDMWRKRLQEIGSGLRD